MKKNIMLFIGLLLLSSSCNDFLREEPKSEMPQDQYFTAPSHAWSAVNQLYRGGIQDLCNAGSAYNGPKLMSGSYMSGFFDNPKYKGQEQFIVQSLDLNLHPQTSAGYLDGIWDPCYKAIARANFAIDRIPTTPGLNDAAKQQLLAEAYFFRAFNYFYLVKSFGDVPLITETFGQDVDLNSFYVKRTPTKDVYEQIVKDLVFAKDEGGLADMPMHKNGMRVSKGAVSTLLADVYLTMSGFPAQVDKYKEAATVARGIIGSGKYSLIPNGNSTTKSAYNVMRTSDTQDEYMYQTEYKAGVSESFWMPVYSFPPPAVSWPGKIFKYSITTDVFAPRPALLAIYDPATDLRIQEKQFFHSNFTYTYTKKAEKEGDVETQVVQTENFDVLPYLWFDTTALFVTGKPDKDLVVYRYAEVLLIAAEAIAQTEGVTTEAAGYLAKVRHRASLTAKTEADFTTELAALSKTAFIEEVWKERLREFSLEFKMWGDIQRTHKIMKTDVNNKGVITFVDVIGATNTFGKTFTQKDLLFPISANEIQRNPQLTQNTGY